MLAGVDYRRSAAVTIVGMEGGMRKALGMVVMIAVLVLAAGVGETATHERTYVRIPVKDRAALEELAHSVELDERTRASVAYAWLRPGEREVLESRGFTVEPVAAPGAPERALTMCNDPDGPPYEPPYSWSCYPTWSQYVDMMNWYATTYPDLCRLVDLGPSGTGAHRLLALVISDNVAVDEDEPEFLYTATMHGDELAGYPLMLRLADTLLTSYGTDPELTALVDGLEIWINPLANPDGTFAGGDGTVSGSQRYNIADGVDLNRSFPDPLAGDDPDAGIWPAEVQRMIDLAASHSFTMSSNFHGGAEVVNYPWDMWSTRHVDDAWWQTISHEYADNAQAASPAGYMSGFDDGTTNGWDWYEVLGGRQDFMNYYHGCRELTIELSDVKQLDSSQLDAHWTWNRQPLLNLMKRSDTGLRGVVTDALSDAPVAATIKVVGHDLVSQRSWVFSDPDVGDFHRPIAPGSWDLEVSAEGYETATVPGIVVVDGTPATRADVALVPLPRFPVSGVVSNAVSGGRITSAEVRLAGTSIPVESTSGDGSYQIANAWNGSYTLRASHPDYAPAEVPITVAGAAVVQDLTLAPITNLVDLDLEAGDGGLVSSSPAGWQWGSDTMASAHSGTKVWGTALDASYPNSVLWNLDLPAVVVPADADSATLVFWHWYQTEADWDGGQVRVSVDGGAFTVATPEGGYPDQDVDGIGNNQPGYSGANGAWQEVRIDLAATIGHTVAVRFVFGADGSQTGHGWYLDDLRVETTGGVPPALVFADGFETGTLMEWDGATGR